MLAKSFLAYNENSQMKTINQLLQQDLRGKRVLMRCDLNVPFADKEVLDPTRILQHKKTIDALIGAGAKVIMLSHFGRPRWKKRKKFSLCQILPALKKNLEHDIDFIPSAIGEAACWTIQYSQKNLLLAENTRFHLGEVRNLPEFAEKLAALGDYFVNDAFSIAHRAHASVVGITQHLPSFAGFALMAEVAQLDNYLAQPKRPALAIIGGAKIAGKAEVLEKILPQMDVIAIGGAMANAFLVAQNKMSKQNTTFNDEDLAQAKSFLEQAEKQQTQILLPIDFVCAEKLQEDLDAQTYRLDNLPPNKGCFDIGAESVAAIAHQIEKAQTILWNGPLGAFEIKPFDKASVAIAKKIAASQTLSVAGGGETVSAINRAQASGGFTHISTAGGAFLAWLKQEPMPALEALENLARAT